MTSYELPPDTRIREVPEEVGLTALGKRADRTAATLREVLTSLGIAPDDVRKIRGAVTLSGNSFVALGTIKKESADKLLDVLLTYRFDRLREQRPHPDANA